METAGFNLSRRGIDSRLSLRAEHTPHKACLTSILAALVLLVSLGCDSKETERSESSSEEAGASSGDGFSSARVVDVLDGVTIRADSDGNLFTVRYLGIDLPNGEDGSDIADRALQFNRFLVEGKQIELEADLVTTDPQGRLLRYVYVDGEMVNRTLLTNGHATVATFPSEFSHRDIFEVAEENARRDRKGVWAREEHDDDPTGGAPTGSSFTGGTLPAKPGTSLCDYSESPEPVIKGNVDSRTGDHIYHVPGGFFYSTTVVNAAEGDEWLCTEEQAIASRWKRSKH